jgi:hypothetical protein
MLAIVRGFDEEEVVVEDKMVNDAADCDRSNVPSIRIDDADAEEGEDKKKAPNIAMVVEDGRYRLDVTFICALDVTTR